jgi:photosystem II stability/assembly factor-like uncharacterized protein
LESAAAKSDADYLAFEGLQFIDSRHGWAVTPTKFLESFDGGETWTELLASGNEWVFYSFRFLDATHGWIVGVNKNNGKYFPLVLTTGDGGKNWRQRALELPDQINPRLAPALMGIESCNGRFGWAVGLGLILHTSDAGETWEVQRRNQDEKLLSVACRDEHQAWAVGEDGLILQTNDGGKTWFRQDSKTTGLLVRVRFFRDSVWVVGSIAQESILLRNRTGVWIPQKPKISGTLFDIQFLHSDGWIVGSNGVILHSTDDGESWVQNPSPTANDLTTVYFFDQHIGWAGGDKRTLLRYQR